MGGRMMGLELQWGHAYVRYVILPFQQGSHLSVSWSPCDCYVLQNSLLLLKYMVHVMNQIVYGMDLYALRSWLYFLLDYQSP